MISRAASGLEKETASHVQSRKSGDTGAQQATSLELQLANELDPIVSLFPALEVPPDL